MHGLYNQARDTCIKIYIDYVHIRLNVSILRAVVMH